MGLFGKGDYVIEAGEFGDRLVVTGTWVPAMRDVMLRKGLKELYLNYARGFIGDDIEFIRNLDFLEGLKLLFYNISDISVVLSLHKLRTLDLGCVAKTLIDFRNFPNLERCYLGRSIKTRHLFECINLTHLSCNPFTATDTSEFEALRELQFLYLGQSNIRSLLGLSTLCELRHLRLALMRDLDSLNGIEELTSLEVLELETCKRISSLDSVRNLSALRELYVNNCGDIDSVSPAAGLRNLETVQMAESTRVLDGDLRPIAELPKLKRVLIRPWNHYSHRSSVAADKLVPRRN